MPDEPENPNPLTGSGDFFVRYTAENVARWPGLVDLVEGFDAGTRPAAVRATAWLKAIDLSRPLESLTRLYVIDGRLVGFYSLANGEVRLSNSRRERLELQRSTQPAVILTWIAKSALHDCDGLEMVRDAVFHARSATEHSAATLLALDPFDEETAAMWRQTHGFIDAVGQTKDSRLPRLVLPLWPTAS